MAGYSLLFIVVVGSPTIACLLDQTSLVSDVQDERGIDRAAVGGMVVLGLQVGLSAGSVASLAVDGGAVAARLGRRNGEAVLGELTAGSHIDAGHVPEDGVAGLGVLELEDVGLVGLGGELDGDAAAVAVGAPLLGVGAAARREGMHVADAISDRPRVDGLAQVVDDLDAASGGGGGGVAAALDDSGQGGGEGSKSSSDEGLGEHHFG